MKELEELARHAARYRVRGQSYKRSSLLKPLDIILAELERCPDTRNPNELEFVKASSKGLIHDHVKRVSRGVRTEDIYEYVTLFFDNVFKRAHQGDANFLLQRERALRSAYVVYMRQALADIFVERGNAKNTQEAQQELDQAANQDAEFDEEE
jgi:hypothetical protein